MGHQLQKILTAKGRMIHIRLDIETHKHLKIHAAQTDCSIQQIVETLFLRNLVNSKRRNLKQ